MTVLLPSNNLGIIRKRKFCEASAAQPPPGRGSTETGPPGIQARKAGVFALSSGDIFFSLYLEAGSLLSWAQILAICPDSLSQNLASSS